MKKDTRNMGVMRKAKKLSKAERLEISILLERGYSRRAIAKALGRGKTCIADETNVPAPLK